MNEAEQIKALQEELAQLRKEVEALCSQVAQAVQHHHYHYHPVAPAPFPQPPFVPYCRPPNTWGGQSVTAAPLKDIIFNSSTG